MSNSSILRRIWRKNKNLSTPKRITWLLKLCKRRGIKATTISCLEGQKIYAEKIVLVGGASVVFARSCYGCSGGRDQVTGNHLPTTNCPIFEYGLLTLKDYSSFEIDSKTLIIDSPNRNRTNNIKWGIRR